MPTPERSRLNQFRRVSDCVTAIPAVVQALLAKYGALIKSKSGAVKLVRV